MLNIIDFDNTLFFTSECLRKSYNAAIKTVSNVENYFSVDKWKNPKESDNINLILRDDFSLLEISQIVKIKYKIYPQEYLKANKIIPNLKFILMIANLNKTSNLKRFNKNVVCSNTKEAVINKIFESFSFTSRIFDKVVGRDTYPNTETKPSTSMFHRILEDYIEDDCLKFEKEINIYDDSKYGLNAAIKFREEVDSDFIIKIFKVPRFDDAEKNNYNNCILKEI